MTVAQLIIDANAVKNTSSGLVEWDNNSLQVVVDDMEALHLQRGCYQVADIAAMELVGNTETLFVGIEGVGLFFWSATGPYNGTTVFNSADGGFWRKQNITGAGSTTLAALTDVDLTSPTDGQALVYDNATSKWVNSNISVSWTNLSGKPRVVQEMTFGSVLSPYNIGFNDSLPNATAGAYGNIVLGQGLPDFTDGAFNTVLAPQGLTDMLEGNSSVVITPAPALHAAATGTQAVERCLILGDCGDLDDLYVSNNLTAVMAIGTDQRPWIIAADGEMHFDFDVSMVGVGYKFNFNGDTWLKGSVRVDGDFDLNGGIADFSGQVTVGGVLITNSIYVPDFTNFTAPECGTGWIRLSDTSNGLPRWRLDTMGRVSMAGGMYSSGATPAAICLTFASSTIHPVNIQLFTLPITNVNGTTNDGTVTASVDTDGILRVYYTAGTLTSKVIWLNGITYFID